MLPVQHITACPVLLLRISDLINQNSGTLQNVWMTLKAPLHHGTFANLSDWETVLKSSWGLLEASMECARQAVKKYWRIFKVISHILKQWRMIGGST